MLARSSLLDVPLPPPIERLRFALLRDGPRLPGGRYVGLETAAVEPWPHQAVVARRIVETWPYSYLLCDEVGLGKTIEAGLAIRSLYLAGLLKRVLISPPAGLTRQWQREMASKFFLPFGRALTGRPIRHEYLLPTPKLREAESLYEPDLAIVSTALLTRRERQRELRRARRFDMALVDEAHCLRRHNPTGGTRTAPRYGQLYQTAYSVLRPQSRCLVLVTATPMQLDPVEVADLIQLTDRVGPYQYDPSLLNAYYELTGRVVRNETLDSEEWRFLRCAVQSVQRQDPRLWEFIQTAVIAPDTRPEIEQWLEGGLRPITLELSGIKRLIFAAAPLSRVMFRHNRRLLEIYRERGELKAELAQRVILPLPRICFTHYEQGAYQQLEDYCRGLVQRLGNRSGPRQAHALGFYLSFLRLRFASSLFALRETLRRRLERVRATRAQLLARPGEENELTLAAVLEEGEDDEEAVQALLRQRTPADLTWEELKLREVLNHLSRITVPSSKIECLLEHLRARRLTPGRLRQTVIFTRFYDTLTELVEHLRRLDSHMRLATYSGRGGSYLDSISQRMIAVEREMIAQRFLRGEIDVLVCTDAAAEGLNLQTADMLINVDLPWNPMKVEQRIGRLDRIGQRHATVYVCNLCYSGSAEEIVYGRLLARLTQAGYVVGTQQLSLLPVSPEEFRALVEGELSEEELTEAALERAQLAQRRTASREIPSAELYDRYKRLEQKTAKRPPVDLEAIWQTLTRSAYLRDLGCTLLSEAGLPVIELRHLPAIPEGTALTVSRTLYEEGLPSLSGRLRFATYGEPVFEKLLDHMAAFNLPPCIRRISVDLPDLKTERVAYAVVCKRGGGIRETRLVTAFHELEGLQIDEEAELNDMAQFKEQLYEEAKKELARIRAVTAIETRNKRAARAQRLLDYLVARSLLITRQRLGLSHGGFWEEFAAMERQFQHRDRIRVTGIPLRLARRLKGGLFEPEFPTLGTEGYIDAPRMLLMSALEAAARLADDLRGARAEISVARVLSRLDQAIAEYD